MLLRVIEDWKHSLEDKKVVGAVLMDLSKAFDCLPHQLIVAKLQAYGMDRSSAALIWSYLSHCFQRVKLGGHTSDWKQLTKGVPQGSILGPIFFNIFINDLFATITEGNLYNYADDNTISAASSTIQDVLGTLTDQSRNAITWFRDNMMEANPAKFQAVVLNTKESHIELDIEGTTISAEECVKLLGVNIDQKLNFNFHVKAICRKAAAQLAVLQRLSHLLDFQSRMTIFRCFILAHFNYCNLVWHFCGVVSSAKLESLQYHALKFVYRDFSSHLNLCLLKLVCQHWS